MPRASDIHVTAHASKLGETQNDGLRDVYVSRATKRLGSPPEDAVASKLFYILLAAAFCYLFLFFSIADIRRVVAVATDDAAYFFKIAEQVALGNVRST